MAIGIVSFPINSMVVSIVFCKRLPEGNYITGWWYTYPSEKYKSQLGLLVPIYGKIKFMFQNNNQIIFMMSVQCWL